MKKYWKDYLIGGGAVLCTNAIWVQSPRLMGRIAYVNGRYVDHRQATVHIETGTADASFSTSPAGC